jgi:hypothetical protein
MPFQQSRTVTGEALLTAKASADPDRPKHYKRVAVITTVNAAVSAQ